MKRIELPPLRGQQDACWQALLGMAGRFGTGWMLIGGQMVLVHQLAAEADGLPQAQYRFSADVDMVMNIRANKKAFAQIHEWLLEEGFEQNVSVTAGTGFKYLKGSVRFDVLAPDGLGSHNPRLGAGRTLQATGASHAFRRTEDIEIAYGEQRARIILPNLLGALLIKGATSYIGTGGSKVIRHKDDISLLLSLITEDIEAKITKNPLSTKERKIIRRIISDPYHDDTDRSRAAYLMKIKPVR